ncbi:UNVERIFIED_CONTAM: Eukaryotic translation initiation factor isoform 4E-2 [Sesamum angustifolium]|uniref:Eukaryotic translation initiation factor isoform 4E n=1 Tax=Sesamum angustifolium TaxID=2727405 RepID=A0AAW2LUZ8_9LAMI
MVCDSFNSVLDSPVQFHKPVGYFENHDDASMISERVNKVHEQLRNLYDQIFRPSKFPANADFHLFRAGVEPKWEDPECTNGGKWTVTSSKKANLDTMWLETLMALIGEQFDEADEICGVVASVRQRQDKLSLWTKTAANEAAQMGIGRKWKEIIDVTDKISYCFHDLPIGQKSENCEDPSTAEHEFSSS